MRQILTLSFLVLLAACGGQAQQTQMKVADAAAQSLNAVAPVMIDQYRVDLRTCRTTSSSQSEYSACAVGVDDRWAAIKDAWRKARRLQDAYATALEKGDPNIAAYADFLEKAYCELKGAAPDTLKLPEVPGLKCKEAP